jgi:hypothetical protein
MPAHSVADGSRADGGSTGMDSGALGAAPTTGSGGSDAGHPRRRRRAPPPLTPPLAAAPPSANQSALLGPRGHTQAVPKPVHYQH